MTAFLFKAVQTASAAEEFKYCDLINHTNRTVVEVYFCAAGYPIDEYGKNLLEGMSPLQNGEAINVEYPAEHTHYNIRTVFENGEFADWENVDCTDMWRITLYKDGSGYKAQTN